MTGIWTLGAMGPIDLAKRVGRQIREDDITGEAAKLAFYAVLSLFPLLLFMTALLGLILQGDGMLQSGMKDYLDKVAPASVSTLLGQTVDEVSKRSSGIKLWVGLLASLWAASRGMMSLMRAMNVTYEVEEGRPWWKGRLVALGLTLSFAVLMILALAMMMVGGPMAIRLAENMGLGRAAATAWNILRWPVLLIFVLFAFNLLYLFAPNLKRRRWHWLMPGTVVGVGLWLLASFAFKVYLSHFNNYSATYGSIATVIILLMWLYVSAIAVLVGAEVNSELELDTRNVSQREH